MNKNCLKVFFAFLALTGLAAAACAAPLTWSMAEEIRTHIKEPVFPDYCVNIKDFGAVPGDGKLDTAAIQNAIKAVHEKGGGTVIVPKGDFDTGAITLLSNVNLHLEDADSKLLFTKEINEKNYPIVYTHWEATPIYNYSPLIYANGATNIGLTGKGVLDGQANYKDTWWNWRNKIPVPGTDKKTELQTPGMEKTRQQNNDGVPVKDRIYGDGWYLRPNFIQVINCKNVLLEGVTLTRSPMWQVNPVLSENIIVRRMTLNSYGTNTDGVDPESCNYVLIEENYFDSGDDCIAIKSGRDRDGREINVPSQNILILNNEMKAGHGGIAIGSEMSGGVRNVFADGNHFDSLDLTFPLRLKTNAKRGGTIENIYLRNSVIENVNASVIHGTMLYSEGRNGAFTPEFKNIVIENVKSKGGTYGIFLEAFEESPITGLVLRNLEISGVKHPVRAMNWAKDAVMENVTINGVAYPSPTEVRVLGITAPGQKVTADALLIAGKASQLKYNWFMADKKDGLYLQAAKGKTFKVPAAAAGKYIVLSATDKNGRMNKSIPYKIISSANTNGITGNETAALQAARLASKDIIDETMPINLNADITRVELARMLARLWDLKEPKKAVKIADIDASSPDYKLVGAVIEEEMMSLDAKGNFYPANTIKREEMGNIAMDSCGVSYQNNATTCDTTYKDGGEIDCATLTKIELGTTLGLWKHEGYFKPKQNMTWAMALESLNRISDFAGK
ncbi:polygalacturonase [Elusimicrobium simillimum]|uniref:glycosyl hydrolase family 28 protein n=1 Tax=Elusimicrobium simillimum TaxID=3143438 RepID=UPI003C6FF676